MKIKIVIIYKTYWQFIEFLKFICDENVTHFALTTKILLTKTSLFRALNISYYPISLAGYQRAWRDEIIFPKNLSLPERAYISHSVPCVLSTSELSRPASTLSHYLVSIRKHTQSRESKTSFIPKYSVVL